MRRYVTETLAGCLLNVGLKRGCDAFKETYAETKIERFLAETTQVVFPRLNPLEGRSLAIPEDA